MTDSIKVTYPLIVPRITDVDNNMVGCPEFLRMTKKSVHRLLEQLIEC